MLDAGSRVHRRQLCAPEGEDHAHKIRFKLQRFEEELVQLEEQQQQVQFEQKRLKQEEISRNRPQNTSDGALNRAIRPFANESAAA